MCPCLGILLRDAVRPNINDAAAVASRCSVVRTVAIKLPPSIRRRVAAKSTTGARAANVILDALLAETFVLVSSRAAVANASLLRAFSYVKCAA